ncbi:cobalt-precorrin 5A hydrolase [Tissierella sp.]|uniref:cobalt-precorrin 5A hydrolase n=1 Tax=Tissierella sp. TaxID=41274 RepID=UPI00285C9F95|nr:cobalt-precorrin 5A hydrolase [Tissierella sp.]MDR7855772.1 cobalt-precorrin 5A hydrolase [Tissierella sp.]
MKIACLSFTEKGKILGDKLKSLDIESKFHVIHHLYNKDIHGGIKGFLSSSWDEYDGFVFISSTGIAVRMINPYIKDKSIDPAIVVIDDCGRFSISLLSGHLGGANELSKWIGEMINAIPVITTASDNRNIESLDMFAQKNKYYIEDMEAIKNITAMMVNGKSIAFYSEEDKIIDYPNLQVLSLKDVILNEITSGVEGMIIISSANLENQDNDIPIAYLRPKNINIGIGCRKGIEGRRIIEAIETTLGQVNLSDRSIKAIGTVEVKKDEKGIIEAAEYFNCPMKIFTIDEIKEVEDNFDKSQFVKDTIGVYSVSEPAAYLLGGNLIAKKAKYNGITISISKDIGSINFYEKDNK